MKHDHYVCYVWDVRWDIAVADNLSNYMKFCFFVLYNIVNEIAFNILEEKEYQPIQQLKKVVGPQSFSIYINFDE